MKHIHIILLLAGLLLVSPVVYATMSFNQNPTKSETPVVTVQKLILEPTYGQISNNLVKSLSSFSDQFFVISSSSSSSNSIISSTVASLSSSSSSTNLNISLENIGQSAKNVSSSSKSSSVSYSVKSESKPNTIIETKKIETKNNQLSSISSSSLTKIKVEESTTVTEKKISSTPLAQEVKSEPKAEEPKQTITSEQLVKPKTYHELIDYYCEQYACNSTQLKRVMKCESTNNPNATNGIHIGLFQFNPNTFRAYASKAGLVNSNIWNVDDQIRVAAYMFANGQAHQWSCK